LRASAVWVWLTLLILVPAAFAATPARTVGVVPGDHIVYAYHVRSSSYNDTTGANITSNLYWNLTIQVQSVDASANPPDVGYQIREDALTNGSITDTYTETNLTTVFDPFNTTTYTGNLGFPAFVFTNVQNETKNFGYNVPTTNLPPWATPADREVPQNITVTVVRSQKSIYVSLRDDLLNATNPFMIVGMTFDAATGVMQSSKMFTVLSGVYKSFYYTLLSFVQGAQPIPVYFYLLPLAVAVVAVVAAVEIRRRPSHRKRAVQKMRKK